MIDYTVFSTRCNLLFLQSIVCDHYSLEGSQPPIIILRPTRPTEISTERSTTSNFSMRLLSSSAQIATCSQCSSGKCLLGSVSNWKLVKILPTPARKSRELYLLHPHSFGFTRLPLLPHSVAPAAASGRWGVEGWG